MRSSARFLQLISALLFAFALSLPFSLCDPDTAPLIRLPSAGSQPPPSSSPPSKASSTCPVSCFVSDPVCGEDGRTYWCGPRDAACNGVQVAKTGFCSVGNGGDGLLPRQALLLVHIVWLFVLGFSVALGLF